MSTHYIFYIILGYFGHGNLIYQEYHLIVGNILGYLINKKSTYKSYRIAKKVFNEKINLFTNKRPSIEKRKQFIKSYIWSVLLYACES